MKFTLLTTFAVVLASFAVLAQSPEPTTDAAPTATEESSPDPTIAYAPPPVAGRFDGYSKCTVRGYSIVPSRVVRCCTVNRGTSLVQSGIYRCRVPIAREGYYRKCIVDLHYSTTTTCTY
ncbi:hypothetical protein DFQ26_007734 [Actinomortierella ambigua]|nr:hypothetical protein DFQ26_007734 [Actinomortierella ambigua]